MSGLPDFMDLKATADYFYSQSCELDAAVDEYVNARKLLPGLTIKKVAKLYTLLKNQVDDLFELSCELDSLHDSQLAALARRKEEC